MMAVILLLAPRPGVLAAIVATVGAAHLGAALAWSDRWVLCGPDTAEAGVYVVAVLGASWLFVERIDRLTKELAQAREEARAAQVRIGAQLSLRAEEEAWVADTLASAQGLLDDIAQGRRDPREPRTRAACAAEAEFLRALLAVGQAPMTLRRPARIWLRLLHAHSCRIQLRGSFAEVEVPPTHRRRDRRGHRHALHPGPGCDRHPLGVVRPRRRPSCCRRPGRRWSVPVGP